jgi:hypothetical protein
VIPCEGERALIATARRDFNVTPGAGRAFRGFQPQELQTRRKSSKNSIVLRFGAVKRR